MKAEREKERARTACVYSESWSVCWGKHGVVLTIRTFAFTYKTAPQTNDTTGASTSHCMAKSGVWASL
jgi:hypothetical protein